MKVLCPIDFSQASINATRWIANFLQKTENGILHITHYVYVMRRAGMFLAVDDIFIDRAKKDMDILVTEIKRNFPDVQLEMSILSAHPKEAIVSTARSDGYDLIVTGSTGLTALKNITIGSVSEYVMKHSKLPVRFRN